MGTRGLEFLLVQSRGGRWIFPKGGVEAGLTQAQSAALEAFEEAGVHGRIEEMPFARYRCAKSSGGSRKQDRLATRDCAQTVTAHLCEVSRLETPQEANRKPTWFSAEKAKRRLLEDRKSEFGAELARVVDRAVVRIQRLRTQSSSALGATRKDALQHVRFEAFEMWAVRGLVWSAAYTRPYKALPGGAPVRPNRATLRLEDGVTSSPDAPQVNVGQKIQCIDNARPAPKVKADLGSPRIRRK
jgi:8-oxo-dGTP pyrophosphatase MutT (NUDIX family)